jgi:glycosyltransferase involved in cell wall biosynthesis
VRVLLLAPFEYDTESGLLLFNCFSDLELTILGFKQGATAVHWSLELLKQNVKALALYRRYDLVFSWGLANMLPLAFVHFLFHRDRPRFVGVDVAANRVGPNLARLLKLAVRPLSAIICFTTAQKNWWARSIGYQRAKFVHLGYLYMHVNASKQQTGEYIFSGGRIARDYQTLVRAVEGLRRRVVLVVGKDPITGRTGLEGTALSRDVEIYYDIPYKRFLELMSGAILVVLPLENKPYAAGQMVLLDAMAVGKPIVATRTAGTIDYVEDGRTGLLVEPGNVSELREKILLLTRNSELRRNLAENAKERWETEFTVKAMQRKIQQVVINVLQTEDQDKGLSFASSSDSAHFLKIK